MAVKVIKRGNEGKLIRKDGSRELVGFFLGLGWLYRQILWPDCAPIKTNLVSSLTTFFTVSLQVFTPTTNSHSSCFFVSHGFRLWPSKRTLRSPEAEIHLPTAAPALSRGPYFPLSFFLLVLLFNSQIQIPSTLSFQFSVNVFLFSTLFYIWSLSSDRFSQKNLVVGRCNILRHSLFIYFNVFEGLR